MLNVKSSIVCRYKIITITPEPTSFTIINIIKPIKIMIIMITAAATTITLLKI